MSEAKSTASAIRPGAAPPEKSSSGSGRSRKLGVLIPYLVIILSQVPLVFLYLKNLWETRPHYQFWPFVFLAVGFLLYLRWPAKESKPFFRSWLSTILLIIAIMFGVLATAFVVPWFGFVSFVLALASLFARTRDQEAEGRSLLPLVLPLVILIQPPTGIDFEAVNGDRLIITRLQTISSSITSNMLDVCGFLHHRPTGGTVLEFPMEEIPDTGQVAEDAKPTEKRQSLSVEEACSGVQSFFLLLFCTSVFIVYFRRPWFRAVLLLLSAVFWAIVMNALRIFMIPVAHQTFGVDLTHGLAHDLLGYSTMILGILMIISTDQFLFFVFGPIDSTAIEDVNPWRRRIAVFWNRVFGGDRTDPERRSASMSQSPSRSFRMFAVGASVLMVLMFVAQIASVSAAISRSGFKIRVFDDNVVYEIKETHLPENMVGWKRVNHRMDTRTAGSDLGERSDTWFYQIDLEDGPEIYRFMATISLDQPFPGWHELTTCYKNVGYQMDRRQKVDVKINETEDNWPYIEAQFRKPTGEKGYLLFSHFDAAGEPFDAPEVWSGLNSFLIRVRNRLSHRLRSRMFRGEAYQVQLFVVTERELNETAKQELRRGFLAVREELRKKFADDELEKMPEDVLKQAREEKLPEENSTEENSTEEATVEE